MLKTCSSPSRGIDRSARRQRFQDTRPNRSHRSTTRASPSTDGSTTARKLMKTCSTSEPIASGATDKQTMPATRTATRAPQREKAEERREGKGGAGEGGSRGEGG